MQASNEPRATLSRLVEEADAARAVQPASVSVVETVIADWDVFLAWETALRETFGEVLVEWIPGRWGVETRFMAGRPGFSIILRNRPSPPRWVGEPEPGESDAWLAVEGSKIDAVVFIRRVRPGTSIPDAILIASGKSPLFTAVSSAFVIRLRAYFVLVGARVVEVPPGMACVRG